MDVAISMLRAELSGWIEHVRAGEEVVITERGIPVARLLPIDTAPLIDQLTQQGVLGKPRRADRPDARAVVRAKASEPVSDLVAEQRR
ncbi:type II toxin-antitoxin system Phd/YefM family antitoxin [Jatrophihabitans sp.]|uniref:type II toxin-antitoxin system Phd/YefM family antitoxin n=1 Tax=Jatrophihabitans sp. TaxID=1932789 RepID=UPI002C5C81AD|nr:type II toxin-antitoxin system prevent-host-death family antitoxin [Jatrophihabitans sp.]